MVSADFLDDALVIVAHPDDEALWFSALLQRVRRVILCFTDHWRSDAPNSLGDRRRRARRAYPLDSRWLDLREPIGRSRAGAHELERNALQELAGRLRAAVAREKEVGKLVTHNPWGEYGHPDHVLVHDLVSDLARERGLGVWFDGYCDERTLPIASSIVSRTELRRLRAPANPEIFETLRRVYLENDCWTWYVEYRPPGEEYFLSLPPERGRCRASSGPVEDRPRRQRSGDSDGAASDALRMIEVPERASKTYR